MAEASIPQDSVDALALDESVTFTSELIRIDTTNRGDGDCRERPAAEYVAERLAAAGLEPAMLERTPAAPTSSPGSRAPTRRPKRSWSTATWTSCRSRGRRLDRSPLLRRGARRGRLGPRRHRHEEHGRDGPRRRPVLGQGGIRPRRDIVIAYTADEEASADDGSGFLADQHAALFEGCTEGISESGAFTFHAGPNMPLYPIAAGERGTGWLKLTAHGKAGHGSKVNRANAVSALAAAVARIGDHEWPVRLTPTVRAAITEIAALHGIHPDLDAPGFDVDELLGKIGPAADLVAPTVRNSSNPTMLDAGYKVNVIPGHATAYIDGRMVPGGEDEFHATLDRLTGPSVDWEFHHREVPLQAPVDSPTFAKLRAAVERFDPDGHVVPYCMSGGTDAKQFSRLGITGYGFSPLKLPVGFDYQALFHGVDERVPVEALHFGVRVLDHYLRTA